MNQVKSCQESTPSHQIHLIQMSDGDGGGMVSGQMTGGCEYIALPTMKLQNEQFSEEYPPASQCLPKSL